MSSISSLYSALPITKSSDTLGRLYQTFLRFNNNLKYPGVYFTPLSLARVIIHEIIGTKLEALVKSAEKALDEGNADELEKSLIHLNQLRFLDPACGSGIFLVAAFQALWNAYTQIRDKLMQTKGVNCNENTVSRQKFMLRLENLLLHYFCGGATDPSAALKAKVVLTHLYGVELDPVSLAITKANLWLELVKINPDGYKIRKKRYGEHFIESNFPYLDFNLVKSNALVIFASLKDEIHRKKDLKPELERLAELKSQYDQDPLNVNLQRALKTVQEKVISKYASNNVRQESNREIPHPIIQTWLLEKPCFSIVCGNPPWGLVRKESEKKILKSLYKNQAGQPDLYRLFLELSFAHADYAVGLITPNTWLDIPAAQKLRDTLAKDWSIQKMARVAPEYFENVAANIIWFVAFRKEIIQENSRSRKNSHSENIPFAFRSNELVQKNASRVANLHSTIDKNSRRLDEILEITVGYQLYHKSIHTPHEIVNKIYHSKEPLLEPAWEEIRAKSLFRFKTAFHPDGYIRKEAKFFRIPPERFLKNQRILVREIPSEKGLIAARISKTLLCPKSILILIPTDKSYSCENILCVLNSRLMQFKLLTSGEKAKQRLFPRISIKALSRLPMPVKPDNSYLPLICHEIEALMEEKSIIEKLPRQTARKKPNNDRLSQLERFLREREAELDARVFWAYELNEAAVKEVLSVLQVPIMEQKAILESFSKLSFNSESKG
ncbi:MAG: Eco57I restriction-modification methylase domain-containing protein [Candidatus Heimdallarchaeota archaeon]